MLTKYGEDNVSQIITFSQYKLKNTIKSTMAAFGYDYKESNDATKSILDMIDGKPTTYDMIIDIVDNPDKYSELGSRTISDVNKANDSITALFKKYPEVYPAVTGLRGCVSNTGLHAGGVIISGKVLKENVPLMTGSDTAILPVIQLEMGDLDFFKLLKIDALGILTLTQIHLAMKLVGLDFDWWDSEDFDDPMVYEMLNRGETTDVFQFSSYSATKMIIDMIVKNIEDLNMVDAGNRPGPSAKNKLTGKSEMDNIIARRNGKDGMPPEQVPKIHPLIDPILEETFGSLLYQEQCIEIGQVMAGYSLGNADVRIRKTLGKKKVEKIPGIETEFIYGKLPLMATININGKDKEVVVFKDVAGNIVDGYSQGGRPVPSDVDSPYCVGALAKGFDVDLAIKIFDIMKEFAKYSFNKAHSFCYAVMGYKCAWLSLYHPVEWAVACLSTHDKQDKITSTLTLCKKRNIQILPPDINKSEEGFTIEIQPDGSKAIRYGMAAIKDVGARAVSIIMALRKTNTFKSFDGYYDVAHQKDVMLQFPNPNGKKAMNPLNKSAETALIKAGAFDEFTTDRHKLMNHFMVDIRKEKIYTPYTTKCGKKDKLGFELEVMGSYISAHPLDPYPFADLVSADDGGTIETTGTVLKVEEKITKTNKPFLKATIKDKNQNDVLIMLFGGVYKNYSDRVKKGEFIIITGELNKTYNSVSCSKVRRILTNTTTNSANSVTVTPVNTPVVADYVAPIKPNPLDSDSIVDDLMKVYGGV